MLVLSGRSYLVTGSSGFIGKALANRLESLGFPTLRQDAEFLDNGDWSDRLQELLERSKPGVIFHVGAIADTLADNVQTVMESNFQVTKLLADWSRANNAFLVFSSSAATYGTNGKFPSNLYGWSKYTAEQYVVQTGGAALRYFNVYGPGESHKGAMSSFFHQAFLKTISQEKVLLFPGHPRRDFVFISDVISANLAVSSIQGTSAGKTYEVGSGQANLFETGLDHMGIKYDYAPIGAIPEGYQFFTKSSPEEWAPGWRPEYSLESGLSAYRSYLIEEYGVINPHV